MSFFYKKIRNKILKDVLALKFRIENMYTDNLQK